MTDGRTDGRTDRRTDGRTDKRTDKRTDIGGCRVAFATENLPSECVFFQCKVCRFSLPGNLTHCTKELWIEFCRQYSTVKASFCLDVGSRNAS